MSDPAPFFAEITPGADAPQAHWITANDGVRLRLAIWPKDQARGSVFVFPGRTEYIEKYAPLATDLGRHRLSSVAIDWRGQGIADRLIADPMSGHVEHFTDYQRDVAAMLDHARDLPKPWFVLGHSMGGAIALRTVLDGSDFERAVFSGPMWGIQTSPLMRPVMWGLCRLARRFGFDHRYPPTTTGPKSYILSEPFETNGLTRDAAQYQRMRDQLTAKPQLQLGAPSLRWLYEALLECRHLATRAAPDMPCLTVMGSEEAIVDTSRIQSRMNAWPGSRFHIEPGGKHELLMEEKATRQRLIEMIVQHCISD